MPAPHQPQPLPYFTRFSQKYKASRPALPKPLVEISGNQCPSLLPSRQEVLVWHDPVRGLRGQIRSSKRQGGIGRNLGPRFQKPKRWGAHNFLRPRRTRATRPRVSRVSQFSIHAARHLFVGRVSILPFQPRLPLEEFDYGIEVDAWRHIDRQHSRLHSLITAAETPQSG